MINELKKNGELILKGLKKNQQLCITDIVGDLGIIRCQARVAVAYLLGTDKIEEVKFGMTKVYFLK